MESLLCEHGKVKIVHIEIKECNGVKYGVSSDIDDIYILKTSSNTNLIVINSLKCEGLCNESIEAIILYCCNFINIDVYNRNICTSDILDLDTVVLNKYGADVLMNIITTFSKCTNDKIDRLRIKNCKVAKNQQFSVDVNVSISSANLFN